MYTAQRTRLAQHAQQRTVQGCNRTEAQQMTLPQAQPCAPPRRRISRNAAGYTMHATHPGSSHNAAMSQHPPLHCGWRRASAQLRTSQSCPTPSVAQMMHGVHAWQMPRRRVKARSCADSLAELAGVQER